MLTVAALALLPECPYFAEFLPQPANIPDSEGEYLRVKWESPSVPWDSISFQLDDFKGFSVHVPSGLLYTELLLHRGAPEACPQRSGLLCLPLSGRSLPNTRATVWNLSAGICRDTAYLPIPKPGHSLVKDEASGEWRASGASSASANSALALDSIISIYGEIPIYISEAAPCPEEGIPEWFEVTNRSFMAFPLDGISDCKAKAPLRSADSIKGKSSILITKHADDLREYLQTEEIPIYQLSIATLKNAGDTLRLCKDGAKLDSIVWGKAAGRPLKCPSSEKISPGFTPKLSGKKPKNIKIAERVLERSKSSAKLRVQINSEKTLELRLIDKTGTGIAKKTISAYELNAAWIEIPEWRKCQNGLCFIHLQGDGVNETAAFIVRP